MGMLFWVTGARKARVRSFFPESHGRPRVDDLRMLSGIIFINRNSWRWGDAPKECGPAKSLYKRWSDDGIFAWIMLGQTAGGADPNTIMIDATSLKTQRTACSLCAKKGTRGRQIGRRKGGLDTNLHAVTDAEGCPIRFSYVGRASQRLHRRRRCRVTCQRPNGCWRTGDMALIGCEKC